MLTLCRNFLNDSEKQDLSLRMPEYGFSLIRIFPYKDKIVDSMFLWEKWCQRKPAFGHILPMHSHTLEELGVSWLQKMLLYHDQVSRNFQIV